MFLRIWHGVRPLLSPEQFGTMVQERLIQLRPGTPVVFELAEFRLVQGKFVVNLGNFYDVYRLAGRWDRYAALQNCLRLEILNYAQPSGWEEERPAQSSRAGFFLGFAHRTGCFPGRPGPGSAGGSGPVS